MKENDSKASFSGILKKGFWKSEKVDVPTLNLSEALAYKVGVLKDLFRGIIFFKTQTSKLTKKGSIVCIFLKILGNMAKLYGG